MNLFWLSTQKTEMIIFSIVLTYQKTPGMICPVVRYAPTAATNPIIAARALRISASGVNPNFIVCSPFVLDF